MNSISTHYKLLHRPYSYLLRSGHLWLCILCLFEEPIKHLDPSEGSARQEKTKTIYIIYKLGKENWEKNQKLYNVLGYQIEGIFKTQYKKDDKIVLKLQ